MVPQTPILPPKPALWHHPWCHRPQYPPKSGTCGTNHGATDPDSTPKAAPVAPPLVPQTPILPIKRNLWDQPWCHRPRFYPKNGTCGTSPGATDPNSPHKTAPGAPPLVPQTPFQRSALRNKVTKDFRQIRRSGAWRGRECHCRSGPGRNSASRRSSSERPRNCPESWHCH